MVEEVALRTKCGILRSAQNDKDIPSSHGLARLELTQKKRKVIFITFPVLAAQQHYFFISPAPRADGDNAVMRDCTG